MTHPTKSSSGADPAVSLSVLLASLKAPGGEELSHNQLGAEADPAAGGGFSVQTVSAFSSLLNHHSEIKPE